MVPSASSRLQEPARRAPPPRLPPSPRAASAARSRQPAVPDPGSSALPEDQKGAAAAAPASDATDRTQAHRPLSWEAPAAKAGNTASAATATLRVATGAAAAARGPGPRARKRAPARSSHNFPAAPRAAVGAPRPHARPRCPSRPGPASRPEHRPPHASAFPGGRRPRRTLSSRLLGLRVPAPNSPFSLLLSQPSSQPVPSLLPAPAQAGNT